MTITFIKVGTQLIGSHVAHLYVMTMNILPRLAVLKAILMKVLYVQSHVQQGLTKLVRGIIFVNLAPIDNLILELIM